MTTKTDLEKALKLLGPVVGELSLAIETKRLTRSQLINATHALREAAMTLEGIGK